MEKTTSEQERADIVAQFLNSTYGESKKAYDETAKSVIDMNNAELDLKETQAAMGEAVAPVNAALTNLKDQALEAVLPLVQKLADGFMNVYNWLQKNPTAMAIVTAVVIALAVAFGVLATALAIQALINGVTKAFSLLNLTMLSNPIVLIIALIAGLVAAFIYLWNNCDAFRQFFIDAWESIKNAAQPVIDALVQFFTVTVPQAWETFMAWLPGFIDRIVQWFSELPGRIWTWLQDIIGKIGAWGSSIWATASAWVSNLVSTVVNWFRGLPGKIWTWLQNIILKIGQWGSRIWSSATQWVSRLVSSVVNWFRGLPGKIWTWLQNIILKIGQWGSRMWSTASQWANRMVTAVVNWIKRLPGRIWTWLSNAASKVVSWGSDLAAKGKEAAQSLFDSVVDKIKGLPAKIKSVGSDLVKGLWYGIKNMGSWIGEKIQGFGSGVLNSLKNFFGISSPSRLFKEEIGRWIPEGISVGIEANADSPIKALDEMGDEMLDGATLNRKLAYTFSAPGSKATTLTDLMDKICDYGERLIEASRHEIRLDNGALVGETINAIDAELANIQALKARGV